MRSGDLWSGQGGGFQRSRRRRRRGLWLLLPLVALLLAATVFLYPAWGEEAPGACAALERRVVRVASDTAPPAARAAARALARRTLDGRLIAPLVAERYRWLPAPMGCALAYWRLRWDGAEALTWVAGLRR